MEVTRTDALALRELIRPFDSNLPDFMKPVLARLATKVYAALIELEDEEIESVNLPLDLNECLLINQKIGNEEWEGALPLLRQSWAILFEIEYDMPPGAGFVLSRYLKEINEEDNNNNTKTATP